MDLATLLVGGTQPVVRDPVTAVITRVDETGVWVSTEGNNPAYPIGPCRGFDDPAGVDVGTTVLLVWTPDGPWAVVGGSGTPPPASDEFVLEQEFAIAANTWVINHGQGTKALSVYTENSLGREIEGLVTYPDDNTLHIDFYHAQTGLARVWR